MASIAWPEPEAYWTGRSFAPMRIVQLSVPTEVTDDDNVVGVDVLLIEALPLCAVEAMPMLCREPGEELVRRNFGSAAPISRKVL